jgi:hypothetical protein
MSKPYPRIRVWAENGTLLVREGVGLCFYIHRPHAEIASRVLQALQAYRQAVGPHALSIYPVDETWAPLDEAGWGQVREKLLHPRFSLVELYDNGLDRNQYCFNYRGRPVGDPSVRNFPGTVCALECWLPTEFLEQQGPDRVRSLALELARLLPFCSGHAGLAFNGELDILGVKDEVRRYWWRYPGLDVVNIGHLASHLGTRVRGPHWMTFLGPPVLGELGGAEALQARLRSPGTAVHPLDAERAVVTLGEWPEAGDTEAGLLLPAYRELARVLEPWTYFREPLNEWDPQDAERRRWERRFLDDLRK